MANDLGAFPNAALPEYDDWLPKVWDAYLEDLVGYQDFHRWARLPATFRWHEFHSRLASAIEARRAETGAAEGESAPTVADAHNQGENPHG